GRRNNEVHKIFPAAVQAAEKLAEEFNLQIITACADNINEQLFYSLANVKNFKVVKNNIYDFMNHAKFGIIKSGTSTLEAGLLQLPMLIVYKTTYLTYLIGKHLVKLKNIGLANIVAGETVVPELIQDEVTVDKIYSEAKKILDDKNYYASVKEKLGRIKSLLGEKGASKRAAKSIYSLMMNEV